MKTKFIQWYFNEFHESALAADMRRTTENSPWHQEKNVLIHTDMVVSQYLSYSGEFDILGALACAFHDVGKPGAQEKVYSEERGFYNRYYGHERISARLWENYIVENSHLLDYFGLTVRDIYRIGWMIHYHLPYNLQKSEKREALYKTIKNVCGLGTYFRMMNSDCTGRVTDDIEGKKDAVTSWQSKFVLESVQAGWSSTKAVTNSKPKLIIPIAASNSGKSTWVNSLNFRGHIHSWDQLRHDWYDPTDYRKAFEGSCQDEKFADKARAEFIKLLKTGEDIIVDNTNLTPKRRLFFVDAARQKGYNINAVLFPISISTILERSRQRTHQHVPEEVIVSQYMSIIPPSYGEFDHIEIVGEF